MDCACAQYTAAVQKSSYPLLFSLDCISAGAGNAGALRDPDVIVAY